MLIINTKDKLKGKNKNLWLLAFSFLLLCSACGKIDALRAKQDARRSEIFYQQAVKRYKSAISISSSRDALRFALGELYYSRGEFFLAIDQLKQSAWPQARRLLAIAYFKAGDFTAALEVFGKNEFSDDEYLYCYGQALEKLNLYDQALKEYALIKGRDYLEIARQRIDQIDRGKDSALAKNMDSRIYKMILNAPPAENYPQAGALILYCDEKVEVSAQNTQVSSAHILVKIINERGKNSFSEASINYDSTYEKVELEFARTIKPDGEVVDVGARHIRDVSKYLNFPLYSNARVFIISFPEISEGACVEYKFKIYRHELVNKKDFVLNYSLFNSEPAMEAYFTVRIPKTRGLKINYLNTSYSDPGRELAPRISEEQDSRVYYWAFKDIPQIIPEANMPPGAEINPTVLLSTFPSWQEIYQWWWGLAKDKIKPDAAIRAKVAELTKGLLGPEDKARAIYNFCCQKIRYVAVEYGKAGHEPHAAADVFRNKYGDCKDQAILLVTMFKEAGLKGWPVLIPTKGIYNLNIDFPSIFFDHCIAVLELKEKLIFLDPTAETATFGDLPADDQERRVIIFQEDGFKIQETPLLPARHNLIQQKLKLKVAKDGSVVADKSVLASGVYEQGQRYWLLYTTPEAVSETLKQKIQEVSIGAVLDNYKIENLDDLNKPLSLRYNFHGPEYLMLAGPLEIMPQLALADPFLTAKDKRVYPLDFDFLDTKETFFEIELPRGVKVKYFPESFEADSQWMDFSVQYAAKGSTVYFYQKSQVKKTRVSGSEYPEFKKFFEGFARKIKQRVILSHQ